MADDPSPGLRVSRIVYRDFDEFADALEGAAGRFIPTARQSAEWWREKVCPGGLCLTQIQIGGPTTFAGDGQPGRYTLGLPMTDPRQIRIDGHFLEADSFILLHEDRPFTFTGQEVVRWAGITLPTDSPLIPPELLSSARAADEPRFRAPLPALERLKQVTRRALRHGHPSDLTHPTAAQAMDEEVALCLSQVLARKSNETVRFIGRPQFSRSRVISRTLALIEANEGGPLFVDDLCRATQVSERTLRCIFQEYFGVGPMRLIKVRQLREIRAALRRADPQRDTVTRIAARFGIWDFSLFARNYKALFGESPSSTLRTPPTEPAVRARSTLSWLHFASKLFIDDEIRAMSRAAEYPFEPASVDTIEPAKAGLKS